MRLPHRNVLLAGSGPSPGRPPAGLTTDRHWLGFCPRAHFVAPDWRRKSRVSVVQRWRRVKRNGAPAPASRAWTAETATPVLGGASRWTFPPGRTTGGSLEDQEPVRSIER